MLCSKCSKVHIIKQRQHLNVIKPLSVQLRLTHLIQQQPHLSHLSFCKQSQGACGGQPVAWVTVCCRSSDPPGSLMMPRLSTCWPGAFQSILLAQGGALRRRHARVDPRPDQTFFLTRKRGCPFLFQLAIIRQEGTSSDLLHFRECHSFIHFSYLPNYCLGASMRSLSVTSSVPLFQPTAIKSQNTFSRQSLTQKSTLLTKSLRGVSDITMQTRHMNSKVTTFIPRRSKRVKLHPPLQIESTFSQLCSSTPTHSYTHPYSGSKQFCLNPQDVWLVVGGQAIQDVFHVFRLPGKKWIVGLSLLFLCR